jgi:hypothetical protein
MYIYIYSFIYYIIINILNNLYIFGEKNIYNNNEE